MRDGTQFLVTWDEPEGNIDEVIEAIWAINEEPFEITQEEFHRQSLLHIHHEEMATAARERPGRRVNGEVMAGSSRSVIPRRGRRPS